MTNEFLHTSIEYLKGVGPQRAAVLNNELNIFTFKDLLQHYPYRYIDRTKFHLLSEIESDQFFIQTKITITHIKIVGERRQKRLVAIAKDASGTTELVWFQGITYVEKALKVGSEYILFGKPTLFRGTYNFTHPELELLEKATSSLQAGLQPMYSATEKSKLKGLDSRGIEKLIKELFLKLNESNCPEFFSSEIVSQYQLLSNFDAFRHIHLPLSETLCQQAVYRKKFEELFILQLQIIGAKNKNNTAYKGFVFEKIDNQFNQFYNHHLPFPLTNAQKKVLKEIRTDVLQGKQMNRLLQGDVGSGKTIVALMTCLMAIDNGFQACVMAPTDILARQHYQGFSELLQLLPIEVKLLTGSITGYERQTVLEDLHEGKINILIGTHALIEDTVQFKNIGLCVIDEQHRFGVEQRSKLWKKNTQPPHVLVMTATPIPRTLAMTLWGDLDVSIIDELPPGRTPIATEHFYEKDRFRLFQFLKKQITQGRQVYIVYPLIEESETLDLKNVNEGYAAIKQDFSEYQVGIMHGKMKQKDKDLEMHLFKENKTQILISTTVIEVGVNVPNATVMVIENAERFGLSQLHQLRGRVGRGAEQSFCYLMTNDKLGNDSRHRMKIMCNSTDGFYLAEEDLKMRGPGNIQGTQQSGLMNFKIANLKTDATIVTQARQAAQQVLDDDPELKKTKNINLRSQLQLQQKNQWGKIS